MRRWIALTVFASLAVAAFAPAQAAEQGLPSTPLCTVEHLTGDACQSSVFSDAPITLEPGVLVSLGGGRCHFDAWVQKATCEVAVPGGETRTIGLGWSNNSDGNDPVSYAIEVRDKYTGTLLYSTSGSGGFPYGDPGLWNSNGGNGIASVIPTISTDTVICEITGTHSVFGATFLEASNRFSCSVNI